MQVDNLKKILSTPQRTKDAKTKLCIKIAHEETGYNIN